MAKVEFCVIGFGRFGEQLAKQLQDLGSNVMVIEANPDLVDKISRMHELVIKCDACDINALSDCGVKNVRTVIVATSRVDASIMICANLKQLGVENIVARAKNTIHERVLKTMGVTNVIVPETEVANKTAIKLVYNFGAEINAINKELCWIKTVVTAPNVINKNIVDLGLKTKYDAIIISIQRKDTTIFPLTNSTRLKIGDVITIVCKNKDIKKVVNIVSQSL